MQKNINMNWLNTNLQSVCVIDELDRSGVNKCGEAYQQVFNGAPFYESWSFNSAKEQILEYYKERALILVPSCEEKIIGFLVAMGGVPENQQEFVPFLNENICFIEEIGVLSEYRNQQIASEMVRILLLSYLNDKQKYLVYRTNAMRYFETIGNESFVAGAIRTIKEDKIKRLNGEEIIIPEFSQSEKQKFINNYLEMLQYYPELDVSNSNQLFRKIFDNINFCFQDGNYSFQLDPTGSGNDRIFTYVDLEKENCLRRLRK